MILSCYSQESCPVCLQLKDMPDVKVVVSFERFFEAKGQQHASRLVQARHHVLSTRVSPRDIARFECVNGIAILAKYSPNSILDDLSCLFRPRHSTKSSCGGKRHHDDR